MPNISYISTVPNEQEEIWFQEGQAISVPTGERLGNSLWEDYTLFTVR